MFDTHCHLNLDVFGDKVKEAVKEAKDSGIDRILVPGTDETNSRKALSLSQTYPSIYAAVGIHPTELLLEEDLEERLANIEKLALSADSVVAIGEIGIDLYKHQSPERIQKIYFKQQVQLAAKLGLAVVIHNRQASESLLESLEEVWSEALEGNVVFHCCEPRHELLDFAKEKYVFMGFDGDITYSEDKQEFVKKVPKRLIVVETDSPFLVPEPLRSAGVEVNEPKNLTMVVNRISEIKDMNPEELVNITTNNALSLFNLV